MKIVFVHGEKGEAMRTQDEEPDINPCKGCEDYDGEGGCKSKGGCAEVRDEQEGDDKNVD